MLKVVQDFPCAHLFQIPSQSFAHRVETQSAYGRGKLLAQMLQELDSFINHNIYQHHSTDAFLRTNGKQIMWLPAVFERYGRKLPTHLTNLSDFCCLEITNNCIHRTISTHHKLIPRVGANLEQMNLDYICFMFDLLRRTCCKCKRGFKKNASFSCSKDAIISTYCWRYEEHARAAMMSACFWFQAFNFLNDLQLAWSTRVGG